MKTYIFAFFLCFLLFFVSEGQELILDKRLKENKAAFILIDNCIIKDSLVLDQVDYSNYYFNRINDSLYHFTYEDNSYWTKNESNRTKKHQIVLQFNERQVHIAFENEYENSKFPYGPLIAGRGDYFYIANYDLDFSQLKNGILILKQNRVVMEELDPLKLDTLEETLEYYYSNDFKVYCTGFNTLNGTFEYNIRENNKSLGFKDVIFINQRVPINKFGDPFYSFFLDGRWFKMTGINKTFTAFREIEMDTSNLEGITKRVKSSYEGFELVGTVDENGNWIKRILDSTGRLTPIDSTGSEIR
jgi:hypothetical protein